MRTPSAGHTYLIGEIGQNHNGSVDLAKLIVDIVARPVREELFGLELPRMDAVKLTRRDLSQELSESQMKAPYESAHSFGRTYGEHRAALELSDEQHLQVYRHAKSLGLDFIETLCAPRCLRLLELFVPDQLKVASRDLTNLPLLEALSRTGIPMILSTGMGGFEEIDRALEVITRRHDRISILHCVSEYPTHPDNANLRSIQALAERYPSFTVGYSDHTVGISAPVAAVALGARIIEKHVTIDRQMKGSDQAGSLGISGIARMVRDVRLLERSLGSVDKRVPAGVADARRKLERSIASNRHIAPGEVIAESDVWLLSPGTGYRWHERGNVVGRTARSAITRNEIIRPEQLEPPG